MGREQAPGRTLHGGPAWAGNLGSCHHFQVAFDAVGEVRPPGWKWGQEMCTEQEAAGTQGELCRCPHLKGLSQPCFVISQFCRRDLSRGLGVRLHPACALSGGGATFLGLWPLS